MLKFMSLQLSCKWGFSFISVWLHLFLPLCVLILRRKSDWLVMKYQHILPSFYLSRYKEVALPIKKEYVDWVHVRWADNIHVGNCC